MHDTPPTPGNRPLSPETPDRDRIGSLPLLARLLLALLLRVVALDRSLWVDETWTLGHSESFAQLVEHHFHPSGSDVHPPLYFVLVWLARFLSDNVTFLRALFLPFGLVSLLFIARTGRLRGGSAAGLAALFLASVSPAHIRYSVELRPYSLLLCFSSIATFAFFRVRSGGGTRDRVLFVAATALNLYTHLFAAILYAAQALFLLLPGAGERRSFPRDLLTAALPLLLFLPWSAAALDLATRRVYRGTEGQGIPGFVLFVRTLLQYLIGFSGGKAISFSAATVLLLAGLARLHRSPRFSLAIDGAMLLAPAALFAALRPDHHPNVRYFLFIYPLWAVLVGAGAVGIGERIARRPGRPRSTTIAILALLPVLLLFRHGERPEIWLRSDRWEDVRRAIEERLAEGDAVVSEPERFTVKRLLVPIAGPLLAAKLEERRSIKPPYGEPFRRTDPSCERIWAIVVGGGNRSDALRDAFAPLAAERRDYRLVECEATLFRIDRGEAAEVEGK
ncbi:MAG: glycosyltransferase family 39 protein [Candidatus Eisenbacteria bacterium]